jgi:hypothetical protein
MTEKIADRLVSSDDGGKIEGKASSPGASRRPPASSTRMTTPIWRRWYKSSERQLDGVRRLHVSHLSAKASPLLGAGYRQQGVQFAVVEMLVRLVQIKHPVLDHGAHRHHLR